MLLSFKAECTVYMYKVCHRTYPFNRVFFFFLVEVLVEKREEHVLSLWIGITHVMWL